jgi:hypothetical protein
MVQLNAALDNRQQHQAVRGLRLVTLPTEVTVALRNDPLIEIHVEVWIRKEMGAVHRMCTHHLDGPLNADKLI